MVSDPFHPARHHRPHLSRACPFPQNVRGGVGLPTPGTQLRVVDPDSLAPLGPGARGLLLARGPGVTGGYWRDEAASARAFRAGDGWFDTGGCKRACGGGLIGRRVARGKAVAQGLHYGAAGSVGARYVEASCRGCCSPVYAGRVGFAFPGTAPGHGADLPVVLPPRPARR